MLKISFYPYESLDQREAHIATLSLQDEIKLEEHIIMDGPNENDEAETQRYDYNYEYSNNYVSLQQYDIEKKIM